MVISASLTELVVAVLTAVLGGAAVQSYRVRLDRKGARAAARARAYRRIRAVLRRWPDGPPLAEHADAEDLAAFLQDLAALTEDVAAAWPSDGLAYTLERLMDAVARMPFTPEARGPALALYLVCSQHLSVLDLGLSGARGMRSLALPVIGPVLRLVRELRARAALGRALSPLPHGLPPLAGRTGDVSAVQDVADRSRQD